jgi:hypothetical protein
MAGGALPMQLQHMLREARISLTDHQLGLKQRAQGQMHEYLKMVNIRTMHSSHQDDADTLRQLLLFAHNPSADDVDDTPHN